MQKFFLVIDTETSGLPKNWKAPYSKENNWPYILQIAWIIYDENGIEVKREDHFLQNGDFAIHKTSFKIHGITKEYLQIHGVEREIVLTKLHADLTKYEPLIIGHFIELDYHMLNIEFYRIGKKNVLENFLFFCTMKASAPYVYNPAIIELKLHKFYAELFDEEPENTHNALFDAINTARIFFHLLRNESLSEKYFYVIDQTSNTEIPLKKAKTLSSLKTLFRNF